MSTMAMNPTVVPSFLPTDNIVGTQSMYSLRKQIRDTTRLLTRPSLPADLQVRLTRKLAALKLRLSDAEAMVPMKQQEQRTMEMIKKYRMVRFFELKKAERRFVQAARKLVQNAEFRDELIVMAKDLCYVARFPKNLPYVALYAQGALRNNPEQEGELLVRQRARIEELSQGLVAETIVEQVRNGQVQEVITKLTNRALKKGVSDEDSDAETIDSQEEEASEEDEDSEGDDDDEDDDEEDNSDFESEEYDSEDGEGSEGEGGSEEDESGSEDEEEDSEEDSEDEEFDSEEDGDSEEEETEEEEESEDEPKKKKNRH